MKLLTRMKVAVIAAICALASSLLAADYSLTIKTGLSQISWDKLSQIFTRPL